MHILATQIATLEEAEAAVDLAQSPADVVVLSFSDSDLSALAAAWEADGALPSLRLADLKRLKHPMSVDLYIDRVIAHAKVVVLRCLGGLEYWRYGLERIAAVAKARGIPLAALPGDDRPDPRLAELSTLPPEALDRLDRYFRNGGAVNLQQALRYIASLLGRPTTWEEPQALGPIVRFHADGTVDSIPNADNTEAFAAVGEEPAGAALPDSSLSLIGKPFANRLTDNEPLQISQPEKRSTSPTRHADTGEAENGAWTGVSVARNDAAPSVGISPGSPTGAYGLDELPPLAEDPSPSPTAAGDPSPVADRPAALLIFYRALVMAGDTAPISALMEALDRRGLTPIAVALSSLKDPAITADLQHLIATCRPKVILNATAFSALRDDGTTILDGADAPVLQLVLAGSSREAWAGSMRGLSAADQAMHVVLPELDGRLLTRAISFKEESAPDPALEYARIRHQPDAGRIAYVAALAAAWARLGEKPRHERRIAMILSDYPARAGRAGYAVGLDTAESVAQITALLRREGFDVAGVSVVQVEAMLRGDGPAGPVGRIVSTGMTDAAESVARNAGMVQSKGFDIGSGMEIADVGTMALSDDPTRPFRADRIGQTVGLDTEGLAQKTGLPPSKEAGGNVSTASIKDMLPSNHLPCAGGAGHAAGPDTGNGIARIVALLRSPGADIGTVLGAEDIEALLSRPGDKAMLEGPPGSDLGTRSPAYDDLTLPLRIYEEWLAALPAELRDQITQAWGAPADDPAVSTNAFHFRILRAGKLIIALQPDRGATTDRKTGYHDTTIPPRHAYLAFYAWLRHSAQIDALIHLGTHGTLEWLPGKALALSQTCWPEAVLGPTPVIYPFIVNNPGEAVQAKRRIGAVTIGHLTPPPRKAGLHGRLAELESLVEEYADADGLDRRRASALEQAIMNAAHACGFASECGLAPSEAGRHAIAKLDARLCDIKELSIRDSFHVFARTPSEADRQVLASAMEEATPAGLTRAQREWSRRAIAISAGCEGEALIRALDGRRVAVGPAGAPMRGRLDVLPTGRNLTSIDPRSIPTRTAATIGKLAAEEVIRRYLQDHGDHPRALILTLWASASLRTGGDDLAQALHYLGATPVWDAMSNRVTGVEILPLAKLGRPRIDVTLRISGLFRDLFETQIALFDLAVRQVAARDEDGADNPLAAARRQGDDLARIFGGAPGSYGAGVASAALDMPWTSRADLGRVALATVTHRYGLGAVEAARHDGFSARIAASSAFVQPQDIAERDVLDSDDIADFTGGMAAAAALLGASPALYHLDTSQPLAPRARTMAESVARVVRGRLTNPRWLAGMLEHGHRGVAEIAQGVDALYAMAATADAVPPHLFEAVHEAVIAEEAVFAAMVACNPIAASAIALRLQDALARGMWTSRRNAVPEELSAAIVRCATGDRPAMEAAE